MGHLLKGKWTETDYLSEIQDGRYVKRPSQFRNWIGTDPASAYPPEAHRYALYWSMSCPWAHRTGIFRVLKKLDGIIELFDTEQDPGGQGWGFAGSYHTVPGTDAKVKNLHEVYSLADSECTTRVTVPVLWDAKTKTIVNNESSDIIRMFNSAFAGLVEPTPDYYPASLRTSIDEMNDLVLKGVNNAVNGCGRSKSQAAYDESIDLLFQTLDHLEKLLSRQRYLCGINQTEADWRLFPNLVRFDPVYYVGYKCNLRHLEEYHHLSNYLRDLYQTPGIAEVSDVAEIKRQTFGQAGPIGSNGIVPRGPTVDFGRPHDRG